VRQCDDGALDAADLGEKVIQLFLCVVVLLGYLFVLLFPLCVGLFESLNLTLKVAGLDIGLAKPAKEMSVSIRHQLFRPDEGSKLTSRLSLVDCDQPVRTLPPKPAASG